MRPLRLSILDQSIIKAGGNAREAIQETIQLAKAGDKLGFDRFWVSEHHNMQLIGSASPEVLIGKLAEETTRIRVGAGGIMLPNHSSLKVAEIFRMLEALYPNRIDLGLGRAPGTDPHTAHFLNPSNDFQTDLFPRKLDELGAFLSDQASTSRGRMLAVPQIETQPQVWILTGGENAHLAAENGYGLALPHFISEVTDDYGIRRYRKEFRPSETFPESRVLLALFVIVADTEERAALLRKSMEIGHVSLRTTGRLYPAQPLERIKDHLFSDQERALLHAQRGKIVSGTPDQVQEELERIARQFDLDEIMVSMFAYDLNDRLRSLELLSRQFDLA